jgi:hypothetical protein
VLYVSGSQPFGLQVPVKDYFYVTVPGKKNLWYCCQKLCVLWTQKHLKDADFGWITVQILFPLFKLYNLGLFESEISKD